MELEKEELKSYIENDSKTMKDKLDKGDFNFKNKFNNFLWIKRWNTIWKFSFKLKSCLKEKEALQKRIEEENRKLQEKIRLALEYLLGWKKLK